MRQGLPPVVVVVVLSVALASTEAVACSCGRLDYAWPSGLKDLPRNTHVLVLKPQEEGEYQLINVGAADATDEIGRLLRPLGDTGTPSSDLDPRLPFESPIAPVERLPFEGTLVPVKRRFISPDALELVPTQSLAWRRRSMVVRLNDGRSPTIVSVFETGDRAKSSEGDAPSFVLMGRFPPNPDAQSAACETRSGNAFFRDRSGRTAWRAVGVWEGNDGSGPPRAMALVVNGRLALGPGNTCSVFGVFLASGKQEYVVREWTPTGFSPPARIAFEL